MRSSFFVFSLFFGVKLMLAQTQTSYNSAEILQSLKKLNTLGSVLYVAAHPDDENTRLLAYMANEKLLRTGYLSLTRGDGGQNLIGKEQGEALGLIRTQELLAARRTDGAEQFFTRANDFGFSKNPEETFGFWNKDSVLADVVWTIRKFKPDVIICRFPTTGEGGHGHHTASAILAEEAFLAAADPGKFPEQLKYTQVWQAQRLYWNTFNFGGNNTTSDDQLKIDIGLYNTLLGKYYGEIAANSRSMHKSQGFGSAKIRGKALEYFKYMKGKEAKSDLFEDVNLSWKRFKETEKIDKLISACISKFNAFTPEHSISSLVAIHKEISKIATKDATLAFWKSQKTRELEDLILACAGIWAEAYPAQHIGISGEPVEITAQILAKNSTPVRLNGISFLQDDSVTSLAMAAHELYTFKHKTVLPTSLSYSNPYWLEQAHSQGLYSVRDQQQRGLPENLSTTQVGYDITIADLNFKVWRPLVYKYVDPVKGEVYRPFEILPKVTVNITDKVYVFPDEKPKNVKFLVKAHTAQINGVLEVQVPQGWVVKLPNPEFVLLNKGDEILLDAEISCTPTAQSGALTVGVRVGAQLYSKAIQRIEYDHIPYQFILSNAAAKIVKIPLKKVGSNIGYIPGAGDEISNCLKQIGYTVTILNDDLLDNSDLSAYDAIVTGIRAYNTNDRLQVYYPKLMDYIKKGGNLVVQYNTNSRVGPVSAKIGPYPFTISRNRVTDENATVEFINEKHSVLNFPHKITQEDFSGWVQERGIYFATDLDKNYETILSMADPNEKASEGSLIVAKYGKGNFVYTGLVFFRELPAGVPGAYKLLVNLLSLPKNNDK